MCDFVQAFTVKRLKRMARRTKTFSDESFFMKTPSRSSNAKRGLNICK